MAARTFDPRLVSLCCDAPLQPHPTCALCAICSKCGKKAIGRMT